MSLARDRPPEHGKTGGRKDGRGGQIRTDDILLPKQALYQAELRPGPGREALRRHPLWQAGIPGSGGSPLATLAPVPLVGHSPAVAYLEIRDLHTHFSKRSGGLLGGETRTIRAVDGVSIDVRKGEILGLVGESGCGKSTLSRTIMQLLRPTSGTIRLDGTELTRLPSDAVRRRRLDFQMVFQDPYASLNPRMTVFATLAEAIRQRHPKVAKDELTRRVNELMETVGLNPSQQRKYPHEFSGGQRQRIAIARALAPEPKLVIADEPVSALDVSIQSQILNLLKKLRAELGLTMIFISHDLGVVRYLADRILVMYRGKIVEEGEAEQLFDSPQNDYTRRLIASIPKLVGQPQP